jgi:tetratricopeptide (TPR) repeat protein
MKRIILLLFLPFAALAQSEVDSALTVEEIHFRDSIAALNAASEQVQLLQETFNLGAEAYATAAYEKAISHFSQVIELDSAYVEAFFNRGLSYKGLEKWEQAIADMQQTFLLDSSYTEALFQEAKCLQLSGGPAIPAYEAVLLADPTKAEAAYEIGVLHYLSKDYESAIVAYTQAISIQADYAYALNDRGSCYRALEKYEEAAKDYEAAIAADPQAFVHNNLGSVYRKAGEKEKALQAYNAAIAKDPAYAMAYNNRGALHYEEEDLTAALRDFDKALEIDDSYALALCNRAAVYQLQEQYTSALDDLNKAVQLDPNNATALLNRGISREMLRDVDGACADWKKASDLGVEAGRKYYINNCE